MGRFDEAWRHGELATQCYDPAASASSVKDYGHDIGVAAFNHLRLPACFLGLPDEAAAAEAKAISLVRRLDHANTLGYERMYRALADLVRRDLERARETCEELIELCERRHMPFWAMMGRAYLGGALAPSDPPRAIQLLERARQERALLRQVMFEPVICCLEGEALMADGQTVKSAMTLEQGIAAATAGEEKWWTPELLRHKARVLLALNGKSARPEAVGVLCEAIEIAKLQHSRVFNLRAASDLAPLLAEAGDRDGARAVLTEACSGLAASTRLPEIDAARRLLAELA